MKSAIYLLLVALLGLTTASASDLFTYQGKLTDATGQALADGQYRIGVRIWDVATGGVEPLWARKYDVPVQKGVFSLMIGSAGIEWADSSALTGSLKLAVSGKDRFLEITVMSDANGPEKANTEWQTLQPRQQLNAVPFAMNGVPTGTVVPFAGSTPPDGWVLCDGQALDSTDPRYASLFAVISTTYGVGTESEFVVPDLRGRTPIGSGQGQTAEGGGPGSNRELAEIVGAETHTLTVTEMPQHDHGGSTSTNGRHSHSNSGPAASDDGGGTDSHFALGDGNAGRGWRQITINANGNHNHTISSQGDNSPHNNMQPSLVLNYIIKL